MAHWLEEAEQVISKKEDKKLERKDKIVVKKDSVKQNRIELEDDYLKIIGRIESLIDRVNSLPKNNRMPFGQIFGKPKPSKLDNLLYKFHSSRRIINKEFAGIMAPLKSQHYKNTRSFFISIAKEKGHILLEYKEVKSKRIRLNDQIHNFWSKIPIIKHIKRKESHEVKENIKLIHIKDYTEDLILDHIDWLAFKDKGIHFFQ